MSSTNEWWGYFHTNGSIHAKRYWGDWRDIEEAVESPFCKKVIKPVACYSREDAIKHIRILLIEGGERHLQHVGIK